MKLLKALLYSGILFIITYTSSADKVSKAYGYILCAGILLGFIVESLRKKKDANI